MYKNVVRPVPGIVARAWRIHRSSGYGYECPTELTEVPTVVRKKKTCSRGHSKSYIQRFHTNFSVNLNPQYTRYTGNTRPYRTLWNNEIRMLWCSAACSCLRGKKRSKKNESVLRFPFFKTTEKNEFFHSRFWSRKHEKNRPKKKLFAVQSWRCYEYTQPFALFYCYILFCCGLFCLCFLSLMHCLRLYLLVQMRTICILFWFRIFLLSSSCVVGGNKAELCRKHATSSVVWAGPKPVAPVV